MEIKKRHNIEMSHLFWITAAIALAVAIFNAIDDIAYRIMSTLVTVPTVLGVLTRFLFGQSNYVSAKVAYCSTILGCIGFLVINSQSNQADMIFTMGVIGLLSGLLVGWVSVYFLLCVSATYDLVVKRKF